MSMKEKVLNVLIFITTTLAMYALFAYMSETLHDSQVTQVSSQVPSRSIQWGDFNFLHTTDTHGWLAGHRKRSYPELNGSGDWGDYASFVDRMRSTAENRGVELFVVDSGDLHDGSGLSDAYKRGDVNGHQTNAIFAMLDIDVLTIGNHGLYDADVTLDIYKHFVPKWNKRYLTSNTFIKDPDADADVAELIPIGEKYRKFTTALGNKVTAFGVMFDFPWPNWRAHVQPIEDMVKEPWFDEATEEAPEFFLIAAHMAINDAKWSVLIDALKSKHPHTPVISFGGHQHIRDCVFNYADERDVRMASGRFLETVGWMGVNITHDGQIEVGRRYLDATPQGYAWHLGIRQRDVLTHQGKRIKKEISKLWHRFNLGKRVGYIDRDLYQNRVPASHPDSLTRWMRDSVLPTISASDRDGVPKLVLMNSGAIRFDLYQGEVTKNDMYTAFPFKNTLPYVRDVPYPVAKGLLHTLNNLPGHPFAAYSAGGAVDSARSTSPSVGYVTNDTCPGIPDDTDHTPLPYYDQPPCFSTELEGLDDDALVDVVFLSFLQPSIEKALHILTPHVHTQSRRHTQVIQSGKW